MPQLAQTLIILGGLLLLGFLADGLGRRTRLPRVTMLLVFGFLIGPHAFSLLPELGHAWFPTAAHLALVMVGFLLGGRLTKPVLAEHGREIVWLSLSVVVITALIEFSGLWLVGVPLAVALVLAGVSPATDPAATMDVVHEAGADGPFTRSLLGIVAIDDAWGLILFSLVVAGVHAVNGGGIAEAFATGGREIIGALLLGLALGVPMSYLTGRVRPGEPTMVEALGLVILCGGLAIWLEVSPLLAAMTMGMTVANLASHHDRPFHEIENVEWPFMVFFFVLSGASMQVDKLWQLGGLTLAYIGLRILGRLVGGRLGAMLCGSEAPVRRWMGAALMPQAGVALGMALVAVQKFPELADTVLPVVIVSTVLFELLGPICTRHALDGAGEARAR